MPSSLPFRNVLRQLLRLSDGGIAALDFYPSLIDQPPVPGEKVVVVMHGLTGGSHESYVRAALTDLTKPKSEGGLGMRGVVMNFRGCADSPIVTRRLYHVRTFPNRRSSDAYLIILSSFILLGRRYWRSQSYDALSHAQGFQRCAVFWSG